MQGRFHPGAIGVFPIVVRLGPNGYVFHHQGFTIRIEFVGHVIRFRNNQEAKKLGIQETTNRNIVRGRGQPSTSCEKYKYTGHAGGGKWFDDREENHG